MNHSCLINRLQIILSKEELRRITFSDLLSDTIYVCIDLHGLTHRQAKRLVKNLICISSEKLIINVIHGYNHGTVLKEMILNTTFSGKVINRYCPTWNPGQTFLTIAA